MGFLSNLKEKTKVRVCIRSLNSNGLTPPIYGCLEEITDGFVVISDSWVGSVCTFEQEKRTDPLPWRIIPMYKVNTIEPEQ
jgi:hypothetical protein